MLELTFLGTSAGMPTKQRNVTALAIECLNPYALRPHQQRGQSNKKSRPWILIDCGEGTQQQLLHTKLSLHQLTAICITHVHGDHCYGLPGLLASAAMMGRYKPLTIIAPQSLLTLIETVRVVTELTLSYAITFIAIENVLSQPNPVVTIVSDKQHQLDIDLTPLSHRVPSYGFGVTQTLSRGKLNTAKLIADGIPANALWGQLQQGENVVTKDGRELCSSHYIDKTTQRTRIVVAGDNDTPSCLASALKHTDLLVHEATYTAEVSSHGRAKNPDIDPMHSSAQLVGKFAQDMGVGNLVLTHFSARYQGFDNPNSRTPNMGHIRLDAQSTYQGQLWLATDFAQYRVQGSIKGEHTQTKSRVEYVGSARDNTP